MHGVNTSLTRKMSMLLIEDTAEAVSLVYVHGKVHLLSFLQAGLCSTAGY
jgi:hypothetical protein